MRVKTKKLKSFFKRETRFDERREFLRELKPLMKRLSKIVKTERWPLVERVDETVLRKLGDDVAAVSNRPVDRVVPLSVGGRSCDNAIEIFKDVDFFDVVEVDFGSVLCGAFPEDGTEQAHLMDNLWQEVNCVLHDPVYCCLFGVLPWDVEGFRDDVCGNILGIAAANVIASAYSALGNGLLNRRDEMEASAKVLGAYLDGFVTLGFKADEPKTLITVTA